MLTIDEHPLLDAAVFTSDWPAPMAECADGVRQHFVLDAAVPLSPADAYPGTDVKRAVRDLLRHGGFKPSGRSKPACEYLVKAVEQGWLSPERGINAAVDTCNVVSLHSGLPISVVDLPLAEPPYRLGICPMGTSYVFNPTGQVIDIGGLVVLHDAQGPCGGPVKDSQRTKTHDGTTRTLTVIWGTTALPGRTEAAFHWHRELLEAQGVTVTRLA